jgi:hypothetical protein
MFVEIEDIKKVNLAEGDIVVLRYQQILSREQRDGAIKFTRASFPDNKVVCLDGGATIDILTKQDIEGM